MHTYALPLFLPRAESSGQNWRPKDFELCLKSILVQWFFLNYTMTYFYGAIILYFLTTQSNIVLNSSLLPAFEISCKILKNTRKVTFYWKTQVDLKVKVFNILTMQGNISPKDFMDILMPWPLYHTITLLHSGEFHGV